MGKVFFTWVTIAAWTTACGGGSATTDTRPDAKNGRHAASNAAASTGIPECDEHVRIVSHCIETKVPTDGIGADQYNLDLSKRHAAAVKDALVKRYGIDANRLTTNGFGKSQPKDTNDTLEGRAQNRRVELTRS